MELVNYKYGNILKILKIQSIFQVLSSFGLTTIFILGIVRHDFDTRYEATFL